MIFVLCIYFSIICEDSKVPCFRDTGPCSLFSALEVSTGEDVLVRGVPPVWSAGGTEDEFVSVVDYDEGIGGMCCCY